MNPNTCPYCNAAPENLQEIDGSDRVRCRACGRKFPNPAHATVRDLRPGEHKLAQARAAMDEAEEQQAPKPKAQAEEQPAGKPKAEAASKPQSGKAKGKAQAPAKARQAELEANPAAADDAGE